MNSHIVEFLWRRNESPWFGFISNLDRRTGGWQDTPISDETDFELEQERGKDLFFSPLVFEDKRRSNLTFKPPTLLFADLDPVNPYELDIQPHIAWQTSKGMYQAVWLLNEPVKYKTKWADLNRRMTYHTGADKGGWAGSKVLRVPGTNNYKRQDASGHILWDDSGRRPFTYGELDHKLKPLTEVRVEAGEAPPIIKDKKTLNKMWASLSPKTQFKLTDTFVSDRSRRIVSMAYTLRRDDVPKETAYHMLWYAPFNKWRLRNNPDRLWLELSNVYDQKES